MANAATEDEASFIVGLITFAISNYSVLVWIASDLVLVLMIRAIAIECESFNVKVESQCNDNIVPLLNIRSGHHNLCLLIDNLGHSGINLLLLSFYLGSTYFLWLHLYALFLPPFYANNE